MGVPKFFRYISERYPCLSEVVKEYQIPQFDNLYLDMNGIIHMCSHPDDENVHFRITEEKIFKDIFHYIEVLFRMIKPQKIFFMAVDGVAPRAKMNQQRGRRFRSAKEADKREAAAAKKGEILPQQARFDSNCITPGTVFMTKLQEQLKYFVVEKISNDPMWQKCKIILSGHETPGEGEHKIMDYIRYIRSQPGYDPNTRHCLYGLDADLIMLGLCTHEPHFCLLREEVKFGKKSTKRISVPEEITFYLLHLSLLRDYLELEFASLKDNLRGFDYDIERIIDDWVLMGFLVGNDFIPNLPNMHIANGALPILYKAYMEILPTLDGYINESGILNLMRFAKFMEKLSCIDLKNFEEVRDDLLYMEAKTGRKQIPHITVSTKQKPIESGLAALIQEAEDMCLSSEEDELDENEENQSEDEAFRTYKNYYYQNKLEYENITQEVMRDQAEGYVKAIQWNLNYYYNGCCSWSWYYPHHYAPYISDVKGFTNLDIKFDLEKPFLPFEQLLAVLPPASKDLLPSCYHDLMMAENSPIKKYYPEDFQTDLNGKRQEWEAVVLVPFIDEKLLLEAMSYCNDKLSTAEKLRNAHGPMLIYNYTPSDMGFYEAPDYFPPVIHNHANVQEMLYNDVFVPKEKLIKGAYPGAKMNVYYPGFPTMKHLKYKGEVRKARIKVFETPSQNENMIISITPQTKLTDMIPVDLLGTNIFVNWPHLTEAKVVAISNSKRKYVSMGGPNQYNTEEKSDHNKQFESENEGITQFYQKRMGIEVGETKVLVHVKLLTGRKYVFTSNGNTVFEKQFSSEIANYPLQSVVYNISSYDEFESDHKDIEQIFAVNGICFTLTNPYYGSQGVIQENLLKKTGRIKICVSVLEEPDFTTVRAAQWKTKFSYRNLHSVASQLSISNSLFSRITGSIYVIVPTNEGGLKNVNIGLDLKLNKRNKETTGYTKKIGSTWCYSDKTVDLVQCYAEKFPDVFEYLTRDGTFDNIDVEKILGNEWEERLKELQTWLRSLPYHNVERRTCGSDALESEVIEEIERAVDKCTGGNVKLVTMRIKPNFLYTPDIQTDTLIPDPKMDVRVLDRIVNVRQGFTVPFGIKGTVIAIQKSTTDNDMDTMCDIVFDKPFKDGMRLNCSEDRGYRLPKTAFINISYGQRLLEEKTGKPDDIIAKAEASRSQNNSFQEFSKNFKSSQSNEWFNVHHRQQLQDTYNNSQYFSQPNSAFAQFDYRKPYGHYEPQVSNRMPYEYHNSQGPSDGYNRQHNYSAEYRQDCGSRNYNNDQRSYGNDAPKYKSENQDVTQQKYGYNRQQSRELERQDHIENKLECNKENVKLKYSSHQPNENKKTETKQEIIRTSQFSGKSDKIEGNDFMPKFNNNNSEVGSSTNIQKTQVKEQEQENNLLERDNLQLQNLPQKKLTVNTQFLKNLLGLKEKKSNNPSSDIVRPVQAKVAEDILPKDEPLNVSFDMLLPIASAPASVKLLTYYQSNGLGLPRYQYFNCGNMTQAQITLADGMSVIGKTANNREEATENIAAEVLELLINKKRDSPPKLQEIDRSKTKSDSSAVLTKSFVPLQVIKSHIKNSASTSSSKETDVSKNNSNLTEIQGIAKENTDNGKSPDTTKEDDIKPRALRKTRIAANFVKKN